jgi:hypothetical protein
VDNARISSIGDNIQHALNTGIAPGCLCVSVCVCVCVCVCVYLSVYLCVYVSVFVSVFNIYSIFMY